MLYMDSVARVLCEVNDVIPFLNEVVRRLPLRLQVTIQVVLVPVAKEDGADQIVLVGGAGLGLCGRRLTPPPDPPSP